MRIGSTPEATDLEEEKMAGIAAKRVFRSLLTLLTLAISAAPAGALPVAGAYPSRLTALKAPNQWERKAFEMIRADLGKRGLKPVQWDALTSAVAREQSQDMAEHDYFDYTSPRLGDINYRLHRAGVSAPYSRQAIFHVDSLETFMAQLVKEPSPFHARPGRHLGIGMFLKGRNDYVVTLIARQKHTTLEPFPTRPLYGRAYRLAGKLDAGFKKPVLIVTLPNGKITEQSLKPSLDGEFDLDTIVVFDQGKGKYVVEILAEGKLGPEPLDIMLCYAGVDYPPPPPPPKPLPTPANLRDAERLMFQMVNRERVTRGLAGLEYDERLAGAARLHSQDMMRNGYFAHVSPTRGDLMNRMERAGIKARIFTENLASNPDIGAAHRGLMESPGHRKNILDARVTRVGIGMVRSRKDKVLFIAQNFAQDFPAYDTARLEREFLNAVNKARAHSECRPLRGNSALVRIARDNSQWMKANGTLGHDRAKSLLAKRRLGFRSVQILCSRSSDPPEPKDVPLALLAKFTHVGVSIVQSGDGDGEKTLWTTVLLGAK